MNGIDALLDSNILIYLAKKELPVATLDHFRTIYISIISYIEVLGHNFPDDRERDFIKEMISLFNVRFIDQKIADSVIGIRKKCHIKLPDAIIARTALADGLCLITRNIEDFRKTDCTVLNPFDSSER
jgi:predicted nucleic acid-binding protein